MSAANFLRNARNLIGAMLRQDPASFRRSLSVEEGMEPRLPNSPRVPVRYTDKRWPREFYFQNAASFLLNGTDMQGWGYAETAPFVNERENESRWRFFFDAMTYVERAGIRGDYHEYGCFSARSFRMALTAAVLNELHAMRFVGFDSFEGLPEPDNALRVTHWKKGGMAMTEGEFMGMIRAHGLCLDRVETVKGFFADSLTPALQQRYLSEGRKVAFANIDCDLFESAAAAFDFLAPLLQNGTLIYLDDYFRGYGGDPRQGTAGAFHAFMERNGWKYYDFQTVGSWGKAFICYR